MGIHVLLIHHAVFFAADPNPSGDPNYKGDARGLSQVTFPKKLPQLLLKLRVS